MKVAEVGFESRSSGFRSLDTAFGKKLSSGKGGTQEGAVPGRLAPRPPLRFQCVFCHAAGGWAWMSRPPLVLWGGRPELPLQLSFPAK